MVRKKEKKTLRYKINIKESLINFDNLNNQNIIRNEKNDNMG